MKTENYDGFLRKFKSIVAWVLIVSFICPNFETFISHNTYAKPLPKLIDETEIDKELIEEGMFYMGSQQLEVVENTSDSYLLKVKRTGECKMTEKVRLTMNDMNAKIGKDYNISVYGDTFFQDKVKNKLKSKSIYEYMKGSKYTEYNYSDAIVDGTINSENQMTEEQMANFEISDEDKKNVENEAKNILDAFGFGDEKGNNIEENEIIEDDEEEDETLTLVLASDSDAEKVTFGTASISDISLNTAWEKFTGLKNDREKKTNVKREMGIPVISELDAKSKAYMQDGIEEVSKELNSAYIDLTFKEGQVEKLIEIEIIDDKKYKGSRQSGFTLSSIDGSIVSGIYSSFTLNINDDEEMVLDNISFEKKSYNAKEGYVEVKVKKTGSQVGMSTCMIDTENISAVVGRDYSEVHAKLVFGMGVDERIIKIPIRTEFVEKEDLTFKLKLQKPENAKIGNMAETICHIRKSDVSFTKVSSKNKTDSVIVDNENKKSKENNNILFGDDNPSLGAHDINLDDIVLDEPLRLKHTIHDKSHIGNSNTKMDYVGEHGFRIYLEEKSFFVPPSFYAWARFETAFSFYGPNPIYQAHYDYCGFRLEASKDSTNGRIHVWAGYLGDQYVDTVFDEYGLIWNHNKKDGFFSPGRSVINYLTFELGKYQGCWRENPTMEIFNIWPIKTMYKVGMIDPACPTLIDDAGNLVPSEIIDAYKGMHITTLVGANESKEITAYSGKQIVVSLENQDNNIFYLSGIDIVDPENSNNWVRVCSTDNESTTTLSFRFDNQCIKNSNSCIKYYKSSKNRREGWFKVRPVISIKKAKISVKKDSRADVVLYDSNASDGSARVKNGKDRNDFIEYEYNVGDIVRYSVNIHSDYTDDYTCDSLLKRVTNPPSPDSISIHKREGTEVFYDELKNSGIEITPLISLKKQKIVVRVKKSDIGYFNQNRGIFRSAKNDVGNYYEYEVVSGVPTFNREYEFSAFTTDSSYTPVWSEVGRADIKYTQSKYYFRGANIDASNILYLTAEKADNYNYSISGTIYYTERVLGSGQTQTYKWQVAKGVPLVIDDTHFGMTDEKGQFSTMPIGGKNNYYVKIKYLNNGLPKYITTKLNQEKLVTRRYKYDFESGGGSSGESYDFTVTSYDVVENNITISDNDTSKAYIRTVQCIKFSGNQSNIVWIDNKISTLIANVQQIDPKTGDNYTYEYKDVDGNIHIEKEHIKRVEFLVLDRATRKEKFVIKATVSNADKTSFRAMWGFEKGKYDKYDNNDLLYVRLVTDRKVGDGTGIDKDGIRRPLAIFQETIYSAVNTGVTFQEEGEKIQEPITIPFETEGIYKLPLIGDMKTMINALGMSFGMQCDTATGRIRLYFGKRLFGKGSRFNGAGEAVGDNGIYYGLSNFTEGWDDIKDFIKTMGKFLDRNVIGIPTWSIEPMIGVYFEFVPSYVIKEGQKITQIVFAGAGGYIGCIGNFKYTFYFLIYAIPCYIGGDFTATVVAEFGIAANAGEKQVLNDPTQRFFDDLMKKNHFEFVFRAQITACAYAGVGLCGVLGVRGGFQFTFDFIVSPMAKKQVGPRFRTTGFSTTGQIKFWADAVLLSIPIPVYTMFKYNQGYFKDLENYEKEKDEEKRKRMFTNTTKTTNNTRSFETEDLGVDNNEYSLGEIRIKPVYDIPSTFEGDKILLNSTYEKLSSRDIVLNSYDDSEPKLMEIDNNKVLMVYIDQDLTKQDVDRTVLKYTIYHIDEGIWDTPKLVPTGNSESADFTPYLCDCGDRILITWTSRPSKIINKNDIESYLENMEVYAVFYNKSNGQFEEFERLTDDNYFDYYPKAIYDPDIGNVIVTYLKASVSEIENSSDFLNNLQTDVNGSVLTYMYYDVTKHTHGDSIPGGWMRDDYWPEEVPKTMSEAERKALCVALKGQRFIASPIKDNYGNIITNPTITEYDVCYTKILNISEATISEIKNKLGITEATMSDVQEENLRNELAPYYKTLGVYSFIADLDGELTTDNDTELFIQFIQDTGGISNPVRVTNNNYLDALPRTVATSIDSSISNENREVSLMWVQDNSSIKYMSLQSIITSDSDTELNYGTVDIGDTSVMKTGKSLADFYPFVDKNGQLYIVWRENSKELTKMDESNYNKPIEFTQDLYVVGHIKENTSDSNSHLFWSKPVRLTDNKKMNELPSGIVLNDDRLLLVNNQYHFFGLENDSPLVEGVSVEMDGKYKIEESNLVETLYKNVNSIELDNITTSFETEVNDKKKYNVNISLINSGLRTARGVNYEGKIYYGGQTLATLNGNDVNNIVPSSYAYISRAIELTEDMLKNIENIKMDLTVNENGVEGPGTSYSELNVFDIEKKFEFQRINQSDISYTNEDMLIIEQYGDEFVISGKLLNSGNVNAKGTEKICVSKNGDYRNPIYEGEKFTLDSGDVMPFTITIPAEKLDLDDFGFQDLLLYVVDDAGNMFSNYEVVTAYVKDAYNFKINGKASDKIEIVKGESINLNVSYSPTEMYKGGTIIYVVEDNNVAKVNNNVLTGIKIGKTTLHLSTDEYGGYKDIEVSVIANKNQKKKSVGSSHDTYGNGDGTGIAYLNNLIALQNNVAIPSGMPNSWVYNPIKNKWYRIGADGQLASGWVQDGNKWYYMNSECYLQEGLSFIDGKWYYFATVDDPTTGKMRGELYVNEMTPLGVMAGVDGAFSYVGN